MPKTFTFVSFNIKHQSQLFEDLMSYVNSSSYMIVGVQEMPGMNKVNKIRAKNPQVKLFQNYDVAFLTSPNLNVLQKGVKVCYKDDANIRKRTIALTLPLKDKSVTVVNIHGFSKINPDNSEKGNEKLFSDIGCKYGVFENRIYMGDFNTNPYESKLSSKNGLNSHRLKDFPKENGMYNPCWNYYSENVSIKGSNYFEDSDHKWQILDQIMVSNGIMKGVKKFNILDSIGKIKCNLIDFQNGKWMTDHLPVQLEMEI